MNYKLNYHILSVNYNADTRTTVVRIVCEDTGEIFEGRARRNPADSMSIEVGTNLATLRAVRKAVLEDLSFAKSNILLWGNHLNFQN